MIMKRLIFGTLFALLFFSCSGFFELGKEEIKPLGDSDNQVKTYVWFNNEGCNYAVDVFSSYTRGTKLASVPANGRSSDIPWVSDTEGYDFYLTYYLPIAGNKIPFIPKKYSVDFVKQVIVKNQRTEVRVQLSSIVPKTEALYDNAWLALKNNNNSAIQFLRGTGVETPVGGQSLISNNVTALYDLTPTTDISGYTILSQGNKYPLTVITSFEKGYLYEVEFNGTTATLSSSKLLTLDSL